MTRTMLMVITLLVGCATGAVVREVVAPARAQGQAGPNYEYEVVNSAFTTNGQRELLGKYGREGWRLVAVGEGRLLYFERRAQY